LLDELKEAAEMEASGSSFGKKKKGRKATTDFSLWGGQRKTDEERQRAIEEARDLNGIDPVSTLGGSIFALAAAAALWSVTNAVAEFFSSHPPQPTDIYVVQRATAVFRNVVVGLFALASGFFGVTGAGILLLAIRVAIGVSKGELDPASSSKPFDSNGDDDRSRLISNAWELMTGGGDPASARQRSKRLKKGGENKGEQ
jgi:hypothetical protein